MAKENYHWKNEGIEIILTKSKTNQTHHARWTMEASQYGHNLKRKPMLIFVKDTG
jgi:hypothetical protein